MLMVVARCRLRDVLWDHTQLYLIMDYVEQDLRQFMDTDARSRSLRNVKVAPFHQWRPGGDAGQPPLHLSAGELKDGVRWRSCRISGGAQ